MLSVPALPAHYAGAVRTLLRFASAAALFALLSGLLFQESSKQLEHGEVPPALRSAAVQGLALVHGHAFVAAVLIPIALAAAIVLALSIGARELAPSTLRWLTRGYLPFTALALVLMLYKGYHVLLSVRFGELDLGAVNASFFGGLKALRHVVYAAAHIGMSLSLGVFAVGLWRSLGRPGERAA